jgi:hypothetical protein
MSTIVKTPTYSLEHCAMSIAVESFSVANALSALSKFMPSISTSFKEDATTTMSALDEVEGKQKDMPKEFRQALKSLQVFKFIDLRETPVSVPDGFHGSLAVYAAQMLASVQMCKEIADNVANYKSYVGMLVSNESSRKDTKNYAATWAMIASQCEKHRAKVDSNFDASHKATRPLGDVFANFNEITVFFKNVSQVTQTASNLNPKAVSTDLETASTYLDMFSKNYRDGNYKDISTEAAKAISVGAYEIAKAAEFYSVLYYHILSLGATAKAIAVKLEEISNS